ncbi:MAG: fumarylacetoacetate hydrolase, partial [Sphingomonadales bacterium]
MSAPAIIDLLPADATTGRFLGRALSPAGPCVIAIRDGIIFNLTGEVASVSGAIARR